MDPSESHLASQSKKRTQRTRSHNWSADQTTILLNLLREEQVTQRVTSQGSFTKQVWNRLAPILSSQSEPNRTGNELQRRWKTLKGEFYDYKTCAEKSGWGWDAVMRIPIAPDESCWEELKQFNPKLYKCKSKSFQWYNVMNELCGSNIATGQYAMSGAAYNEQLEDNISKSDSSDSDANADAVQELSDFDIHTFRNTMGGNYNFSVENSVGGTPVDDSLGTASGTSGTSSGKRTREGSIGRGNEVSSKGKKSKGEPSHSNNNNDNNASILLLIEESRERRMVMSVGPNSQNYLFKDALGAIDGTHIPAIVKRKNRERHRNRKGTLSQNVLAACSFDMLFVYVAVGWEGSASDMKVLRWAMENGGFTVPNGRYYLADLGYANTSKFICPYRNHQYHLAQFSRQNRSSRYVVPEDLYNHRHAQLRNVIERTFGVLKMRFKILQQMPRYKFRKQALVVVACCIIHNFIKMQNTPDLYLHTSTNMEFPNDNTYSVDSNEMPGSTEMAAGEIIRNDIKNALWRQRRRRN